MQNNVTKRTLAALLCAIALCLSLFAWFCLPLPTREVQAVPDIAAAPQEYTERSGVKYIGSGFEVREYTNSVKRGETAVIKASADDGTVIDICAYYKSGKSESTAFVPKTVSGEYAVWEWSVPKNSTVDIIRIVLKSRDTYATFEITVI